MDAYLTPAGYGEAELVEKRSRFIGRVWPVDSEQNAISRIREAREKHRDATHNVYAYILRENNTMRYSDDGEPSGTSGIPALNVFRFEEITDVCCVVTRYFGGTLLGAGGLARAYSAAAKLALDDAGRARMALWSSFLLTCAYGQYERVRRILEGGGAVIESTDFGADVTIGALVLKDEAQRLSSEITELTAGTATVEIKGEVFRGVPL